MNMFAIGVDSDPTMVHFLRLCAKSSIAINAINLRQVVQSGSWHLEIGRPGTAMFRVGDRMWDLSSARSIYNRAINLATPHQPSEIRIRWQAMMMALCAWLDAAPGLVVNRPSRGCHNASKPLHEAYLSNLGFLIPESLTSSDANKLKEFAAAGRTIVKTLCGTRANAREVYPDDFARYEHMNGPVHLQRIIQGADIRAHVVDTEVLALRIEASSIDYRRDGNAIYTRFDLSRDIKEKLVVATKQIGLSFAGWDLKEDSGGRIWCLEANPMPGYSHYDRYFGGEVTDGLIRLMERGEG